MPETKHHSNIRFVPYKEIDKKKWDSCIYHSVNELPYAYSGYLDKVCKRWDALVAGNYDSVFPLTYNRKAAVYYLYQPFFTQQLGLFSGEATTADKVEAFLAAIPAKYRLIEINLNTANIYKGTQFATRRKLTHLLRLDAPHEKIRRGYNENANRNLKKALKEEVQITEDVTPEQLITLFRKNMGDKVKELKSKDYERLKSLMKFALAKSKGEIIGVNTAGDKLCAAGFFMYSRTSIINIFPCSTEEGKKNSAMFFLLDYMLEKNKQSGLTFDFEGSEIPSIARFYKSFGAKESSYLHIRRNTLPWHLNWLKR